ncbi:hypothetical protein BGX28_001835 [Mortierella sp. GBA30]|nr:hypothetical protein BGX28_001835 [Mortierella sp. GBA30]
MTTYNRSSDQEPSRHVLHQADGYLDPDCVTHNKHQSDNHQHALQSEDDDVNYDSEYDAGDDDGDSEREDTPDPLYIADMLRQLDVDWIHRPECATHQLIVVKDPPSTVTPSTRAFPDIDPEEISPSSPPPQHYLVMAQFLIAASAVFRDTLKGQCSATDLEEHDRQSRGRLSCIQILSKAEASSIEFFRDEETPSSDRSIPSASTLPSSLLFQDSPLDKNTNDASMPILRLSLPFPEHFPALLRVMYDHDLDHWERTTFKPETIAAITQNVRRLECLTKLTLRCLEYYRSIRQTLEQMQQEEHVIDEETLEDLKELYRRAIENGMLEGGLRHVSSLEM